MAKINDVNQEILRLAKKYYAKDEVLIETIDDLRKLSYRQLNNITNWATNTDPNSQARIKGNKYSGNTYGKIKKIF
jgi:hypothetical protein